MTLGVGSGAIGAAFAPTLARVGIEAIISNSRGPDSLKELVRELGPSIKAGPREEAARADIVFGAANWTKLPVALAGLPDWSGLPCRRRAAQYSSREPRAAHVARARRGRSRGCHYSVGTANQSLQVENRPGDAPADTAARSLCCPVGQAA